MTVAASASTSARNVARAMTVLAAAYPLAAHFAVLSANAGYVAASVGLLVLVVLTPALTQGRRMAWALLLLAGLGLYFAASRGQAVLLVFLPPVLITGFMAWMFGHTLRPPHQPLIERIIRALHDERDDIDLAIVTYARQLTLAWTVLFVTLAVINFTLAALATPGGFIEAAGFDPPFAVSIDVWSLFANVLNYVFVGAMFAIEFQLRRRRFPQQTYRGFFDFLRKLSRVSAIFSPTRQPRY